MTMELTRKQFMVRCAAGLTAFAFGCGDDGADDTGAGTTGNPSTSGGPASGSGMSSDPTADTSSGSEGSSESGGSSSSEGSGSSSGSESGSDTDVTTGGESACRGDVIVAAISLNHEHVLEVPVADIEAGVEVTYDASGTAGHCHAVTLTAEDFATLRAGGVVTKFSCNGGDHQFVLSCAPGAPAPVDPAADCVADPEFGTCA
jgi:hypothetical protein